MRLITTGQVKGAVTDTLQLWLPYHLARAEEADGLTVGTVPQPREWREPQTASGVPNLAQTPLVVVTCPGLAVIERTSEDVDAGFEVMVDAVVRGQTYEQTAQWAGVYDAAIRSALDQHGTLDGFAEETRWQATDFARLADDEQRTLGEALLTFHVYVAAIHELYGLESPPEDNLEPDANLVEFTNVTVQPEEAA